MAGEALYYPWTRVRDEAWLKSAALFWRRIYVVAPPGYPRRESYTAAVLRHQHGILRDADPSVHAYDVAREFLTLIDRRADELTRRYGWLTDFPAELYRYADHGEAERYVDDDRVSWLHLSKIEPRLSARLLETRLAVTNDDRTAFAVHPRLASVYLTALADRVATANTLTPVTDRQRHHAAVGGWTLDTLTRLLLSDGTSHRPPSTPTAPTAAEISDLYVALAVRTVVPGGLADVPVDRVIAARRRLGDQFDAFRAHLDALGAGFLEIAQTPDQTVRQDRLEDLFDQHLRRPRADLERSLRRLRWQPVAAVVGVTSAALPLSVGWIPDALGLPPTVAGAGAVAATVVASTRAARAQARDQRHGPAGYLLSLRSELAPAGVVQRVRRAARRARRPF